jgi:hypothetical protein
LAGLAALTGCDLDDLDPRGSDDPTPAGASGAPVDADQQLVDEVSAELIRLGAVIGAAQRRFPKLRTRTAPFRTLHAAHLDALGSGAAPPPVTGVLTTAGAALQDIRTQESRLQRRLADWSVAAESGALARLLASMSAAVAQQLAVA